MTTLNRYSLSPWLRKYTSGDDIYLCSNFGKIKATKKIYNYFFQEFPDDEIKIDDISISKLLENRIIVEREASGFFVPANIPFFGIQKWDGCSSWNVGILGIPYDLGTFSPYSNTGARFAPEEARSCSDMYGDAETGIYNLNLSKIVPLDNVCDIGDIILLRPFLSCEDSYKIIKKHLEFLSSYFDFIITVGGDHSITAPIIPDNDVYDLVWFDAHLDYEKCQGLTHNNVLRRIVSDKNIRNIYIIGARRFFPDKSYKDLISRGNVFFITSPDALSEILSKSEPGKIYCSIDMDVLDPSIAHDVGYPIPDGLKIDDLFLYLDLLMLSKYNVKYVDIVESYHNNRNDKKVNITSSIVNMIILHILSMKVI